MEVLKKLANQAQGAVTVNVVSGATDTVNKAGHDKSRCIIKYT